MAVLRFKATHVAAQVLHAKNCDRHKLTISERLEIYGEEKGGNIQPDEDKRDKPGLWLVKDQGIYLMSNGVPGLKKKPGSDALKVVYAEGYNPGNQGISVIHDKCRAAVGGDDFCEALPLDFFEEVLATKPAVVRLHVTTNRIKIELPEAPILLNDVIAELRPIMAAKTVFIGMKTRGRKLKVWTLPKRDEPAEATKREAEARGFKGVTVLNELPAGNAARLYAEVKGIKIT